MHFKLIFHIFSGKSTKCKEDWTAKKV